MLEFLLSNENVPFVSAIVILSVLFFMEMFGLLVGYSFMDSFDVDGDADFDHNIDGDIGGVAGDFFHWVGVGRVPILMLVAVFSGIFGIIGLTANQIASHNFGILLPPLLTAPIVFLLSLPLLSKSAGLIAKYLPRDETNAISVDGLIGLTGTIVSGTATNERIAFARVYDMHGTQHEVRVISATDDELPMNSKILLVSRNDQGQFLATKN